jgi:hypothetical protein
MPPGWRFRESVPKLDGVEQSETAVVLPELQGTYTRLFSHRSVPMVAQHVKRKEKP